MVALPRRKRLGLVVGVAVLALSGGAPIACTQISEARALPDGDGDADAATAPPPDAASAVEAGPTARDCSSDRAPDGLATHLACADLYADFATKTIAADTRPFAPASEFWSDGAEKQRYVYLPAGSKIDISSFDEWRFPGGTRLWKQFKVEGKRIETRLFMKTDTGWKRTVYRWNADETDAIRMEAGERIDRDGGPPYEVPKVDQCDYCHAGRVEPVLGFQAIGLGLAGATGVTLATLAAESTLSTAPPATSLTLPEDSTGVAAPAVGWLHTNCGHCHNDNPKAGAYGASLKMLVRPSELVGDAGVASPAGLAVYRTGYCKPSERQAPTGGFYLYIAGGSVEDSLAAILLGSRATPGLESIVTQMPPLLTHVVDTAGQKRVDDWVTALPRCP